MQKFICSATLINLFVLAPFFCLAWDGIDTETGESVEIDKGNLVRRGQDIEIWSDKDGYHDVTVENITRFGSSVDIEVYDYNKGEYRTLEMEDR